jgi:putative transposase
MSRLSSSMRAVESPTMSVAPLQFLLLVFAGWVNRRQIEIIEYLQEENRVLREQLGGRRLRFTDAQRRRLAVKGRAIIRRALEQLAGLVTPDTIIRWYRVLIAKRVRRQLAATSWPSWHCH